MRVNILLVVVLLVTFFAGLPAIAQRDDGPPRVDRFVEMQTTKGTIIMRIAYSIVPYTAGNFLDLVHKGFYDGLTFHRVENWVVQGGDPNGNGTGDYVDPRTGRPRLLKLEIHPQLTHNQAGMVAMARSADPNSASCQFYIIKQPMPRLNGQYAVFGKVVKGMDVVHRMQIGDRILSARILPLPEEQQQQNAQQPDERSAPPAQQQQTGPPPGSDSGF